MSSSFLRSLWRGVGRAVFWTYRRGSWQYDVLVVLILAFIFFTPRSWLGDRPASPTQNANPGSNLASSPAAPEAVLYRVDAELLESRGQVSVAAILQEILERQLSRPLKLRSFAPVKNAQGVVVGYDVLVESTQD